MLLGGKGGCQQCACVPCNPCERTCTNPHTGTAFEVVYTRFFEGAEAGNTTDGFFTATGDSDTSDPYDGMDGNGPWYQRVSGGFTLGGSSPGTRFPCSVVVSFWRNNYVLGASTIPPPSSALTENIVEVIVSTGSLVAPDGRVITAADGAVTVGSVPLVSGGGDASTSDPRTGEGTVSYSSLCDNVETTFTIRATIRWNTKKRQHVLYGIVRECYEEGTPCATVCSGSPPPNTIYLTIKNVSLSGGATVAGLAGTYVMTRAPNLCDLWENYADLTCSVGSFWGYNEYIVATSMTVRTMSQSIRRVVTIGGVSECVLATLYWFDATPVPICGAGLIKSGTGGQITFANGAATTGTFDWEISA